MTYQYNKTEKQYCDIKQIIITLQNNTVRHIQYYDFEKQLNKTQHIILIYKTALHHYKHHNRT